MRSRIISYIYITITNYSSLIALMGIISNKQLNPIQPNKRLVVAGRIVVGLTKSP
jgi:hypothetical protein